MVEFVAEDAVGEYYKRARAAEHKCAQKAGVHMDPPITLGRSTRRGGRFYAQAHSMDPAQAAHAVDGDGRNRVQRRVSTAWATRRRRRRRNGIVCHRKTGRRLFGGVPVAKKVQVLNRLRGRTLSDPRVGEIPVMGAKVGEGQ